MNKLWLDCETSGLDAEANGILQLACIVEANNGKIVDTFEVKIKPFKGCDIKDEALAVNGFTRKQIKKFVPEDKAIGMFTSFLQEHAQGQFSIAGYNSRFDQDFIIQLFERSTEHKYWDYFNYYDIDVYALVKILGLEGKIYDEVKKRWKPSKQLGIMCEKFGIKLKPHDAIEDIKATRKLYKKLSKKYLK